MLTRLYDRLRRGQDIDTASVDAAIRLAQAEIDDKTPGLWRDDTGFRTRKRRIAPRSAAQAHYVKAMREHELVFGLGPAGTGKTYLAVAAAIDLLMTGKVERIILSRPAVEAGERLGFLPGDLREKVDPYLRPIFDALNDMLPADQLAKRLASGEIEIAPLAFMRGRTLAHAFVILDEAQNTTPVQMKMFLTRLGEGSRMVVTGDPTQVDLPPGARSGLADALEALRGVEDIGDRPVHREGCRAPQAGGAHRRRLRGARPRPSRRRGAGVSSCHSRIRTAGVSPALRRDAGGPEYTRLPACNDCACRKCRRDRRCRALRRLAGRLPRCRVSGRGGGPRRARR